MRGHRGGIVCFGTGHVILQIDFSPQCKNPREILYNFICIWGFCVIMIQMLWLQEFAAYSIAMSGLKRKITFRPWYHIIIVLQQGETEIGKNFHGNN